MARSEEKAQSMLNKWWSMKRGLYLRDPDEPPPLVTDCHSLTECYRWREQIIKEIGDKVAEIQNAGLGEFRIRAMNDQINQLLNSKRQWEDRIRQLGGQDYRKKEQKYYDSDGQELPGSGGYKYFGAAKDLPGVRELFFTETPVAPVRDMATMYKDIPYDYFEFGDDQEQLCELKLKEEKLLKTKKEDFLKNNSHILKNLDSDFDNLQNKEKFIVQIDIQRFLDLKFLKKKDNKISGIKNKLQNKEDEEKKQLEERKRQILQKYVDSKEDKIEEDVQNLASCIPKQDLEELYSQHKQNN